MPSELSFLSGCSKFSNGWEINFFSQGGSVYFGSIHLKISIFS